MDEVSADIKNELAQTELSKNYLKRCFQLVLGFLVNLSTGVLANEITPLVDDVLILFSVETYVQNGL